MTKEERLRIAAIDFLNPAPLMWDFEHPPLNAELAQRYQMRRMVPSECARQLILGKADLGLIPIAALAAHPELRVLPGCTIASKGHIRSLLLVRRASQPLDQIRSVAADTASRTTVTYARLLFHKWGNRSVPFVPMKADLDPALYARRDREARFERTGEELVYHDMAEEWRAVSGLPYISAVWCVAARGNLSVESITEDCIRSRDHGLRHIHALAAEWAPRMQLPEAELRDYLGNNLHYVLDDECLEGIRVFFETAASIGVLPKYELQLAANNKERCATPAPFIMRNGCEPATTGEILMAEKIALITGANRGIGFETARQLGKAGVHVLVGARTADSGLKAIEKLAAEGIEAELLALEVNDAVSREAAAKWIDQRHGRLDILVNNAGVASGAFAGPTQVDLAASIPEHELRRIFETNFFSLVEITQAVLPLLRKSEAGRIVNLASILGSLTYHATPGSPVYDAKTFAYDTSKTAVNAFTIHLAYELRGTRIKVNSAHPGWVKTDMGGAAAPMDVTEGAKTSVALALLGEDGPTGGFFHLGEPLPW
jgi:NAD(P)-dependent dehydrogenase (short-subunit alcohol dehydrogenase family)/predicted solute-binding protein